MGKNKIKRFRENETFRCLLQPEFDDIFHKDHPLKGCWRTDFFGNDRPVCLELGCGKGEYTVALGRRHPDTNFLGVDIKGARMWRGAKTAAETGMTNVGFLRTRIEFIDSFFAPDEVDEIWITFPDPQLKMQRAKKRLTSAGFLALYAGFLRPDGVIHLKTDSRHLHDYTRAVAEHNGLVIEKTCADIYGTGLADEVLSVKTAYEMHYLSQGVPITYLRFRLDGKKKFSAPDFEPDNAL
ncbi:MAG: tRNA (guanosine(46)-N7)-methyltransferase TrmB [Rikenellaceae bacterium]|jgi:tRNA (guanine-N7-)-methyltransferase|nr:tRNA (guanosine(46)-N7)-methyltransferase TrmB [Rikenellaceae bacterium]